MKLSRTAGWHFLLLFCACPKPPPTPDAGQDAGAAQPPEITSVSPSRGPQSGGTLVAINGAFFQERAQVFFGSQEAREVTLVSPSKLTAKTPAASQAGAVEARVQNPDGQSGALSSGFTYDAEVVRTIENALVLGDLQRSDTSGANPVSISVQAELSVPGLTQGAGQGSGVRAQVGFASTLSTPIQQSDFVWSDAGYLADADGAVPADLARDRYQGQLDLPGAQGAESKRYFLAARFSLDEGASWTVADRDGSSNGLAAEQLPRLSVVTPLSCRLQSVDQWTVPSGESVYAVGTVRMAGVTEGVGQGGGIRGQAGVGTENDDASASVAWGWKEASYLGDADGGEDEYRVELHPAYTGARAVSFRFSHDDGGSWTYCDLNGSATGGYEVSQQWNLGVTPPTELDFCKLQWPPTLSLRADGGETVYGQVYEAGTTEGAGADPSISGWLGWGKKLEDPGVADSWSWVGASYNLQVGNNDEYQASFSAAPPGSYSYAFRFRRADGGDCFADLDGNGANGAGQPWGGFSGETAGGADNLGRASVSP